MTEIFAQFGAILFQAGAFAALVVVTPALYGLVIAMRRWWLVLGAVVVLLGLVARITYGPEIALAIEQLPDTMTPNTVGYAMVAVSYVLLAAVVRLATLRLEWLGWKAKSIKDIHVLGYLAPTVAAVALMLPVF